jgi:phage tail protein X
MSRQYITTQGDMWDSIAFRQLGSVSHTDKLINSNRQYREFYIFPAGITLTLPVVAPSTADNLPPWKQVTA